MTEQPTDERLAPLPGATAGETLAASLRRLGFSLTARFLEIGRIDRAEAIQHIRERVVGFEAAEHRTRRYAPGTVGAADHRRFVEWLDLARAVLRAETPDSGVEANKQQQVPPEERR